MSASTTFDQLADLPEGRCAGSRRGSIRSWRSGYPSASPRALLDVKGASDLLHMTPTAVRSAAYRGSLPCVRVGSRLRFRPSELLPR